MTAYFSVFLFWHGEVLVVCKTHFYLCWCKTVLCVCVFPLFAGRNTLWVNLHEEDWKSWCNSISIFWAFLLRHTFLVQSTNFLWDSVGHISIHYAVFKTLCSNLGSMLGIIVLQEVFLGNPICLMPSIFWGTPVPFPAKHPHDMIAPPPCFTVWMVFFRLKSLSLFPSCTLLITMAKQFPLKFSFNLNREQNAVFLLVITSKFVFF